MSLRDGTKKMSKSDASDYSRILMTDDNDTIALKIKKAKTDSLSMQNQVMILVRDDRKSNKYIPGLFRDIQKHRYRAIFL